MLFKNALSRAIEQWNLMIKFNISKDKAYKKLGGTNINYSCFLCDACFDFYLLNPKCFECLTWNNPKRIESYSMYCVKPNSVYKDYIDVINGYKYMDKPLDYYIKQIISYLEYEYKYL